jgi:hypothetical protein
LDIQQFGADGLKHFWKPDYWSDWCKHNVLDGFEVQRVTWFRVRHKLEFRFRQERSFHRRGSLKKSLNDACSIFNSQIMYHRY